jgi:hypothetical protein
MVYHTVRIQAALLLSAAILAACASEELLAVSPPAGVDLSGHWKLNVADSDDPQRIMQSQILGGAAGPSSGGRSGGGRRGGRGGGRQTGGPGGEAGGFDGGVMPPAAALGEGLRWPGKDLEIKQIAGVAAFSSDGSNQVYQPAAAKKRHGKLRQNCGWDGKSLVVKGDDDHPDYEERYSVTADGQRLVQLVGFKGGNSRGFTMSRVWDRVQ